MVSPGVPLNLPALEAARRTGVEIIGELEWAWRFCRAPVAAVTGTKRKRPPTTELIGAFLKEGGRRAFVGGNLGTPLSQWLTETADASAEGSIDWCILEVSSFQLDTAPTFAPTIGVVLNVTPDHLDRYPDFDATRPASFPCSANRPGCRRPPSSTGTIRCAERGRND